jgi:hypothetical protein
MVKVVEMQRETRLRGDGETRGQGETSQLLT